MSARNKQPAKRIRREKRLERKAAFWAWYTGQDLESSSLIDSGDGD